MSLQDRVAFACCYLDDGQVPVASITTLTLEQWVPSLLSFLPPFFPLLPPSFLPPFFPLLPPSSFLPTQLHSYASRLTSTVIQGGKVEGLFLAGLNNDGITLLKNYVNQVGFHDNV